MRSSRKDSDQRLARAGRGVGRDQKPAPGDRRERGGDLEFGIVAPAGALVGVGPGVVEHVFALAVALEIAGGGGDHAPARVLDDDMRRRPARAAADRAGGLKRVEKRVRDEWVEPLALSLLDREAGRIGAGVPRRRVEGGNRRGDARSECRRRHCGRRSGQGVKRILEHVAFRRKPSSPGSRDMGPLALARPLLLRAGRSALTSTEAHAWLRMAGTFRSVLAVLGLSEASVAAEMELRARRP